MPGLRLIAITPRRKTINIQRAGPEVDRRMRAFAVDMSNAMAEYPAQRPTTYRRTGSLGRGWQIRYTRTPAYVTEVAVVNLVPYTAYVQGPKSGARGRRQTRVMRERGWQNITDESRKVWQRYRPLVMRAIQTV